MKRILSIMLIIFFCCTLSGCKCSKKDDIVYRGFYEQDVTTFNYVMTNDYKEMIQIANLVDGLVENDKYGNIVPSIAKSWKSEIVNGKQIWTFYLRDNAYWSDYKGNKYSLVTAHDFVTSIKYILNYNIGSGIYNLPATLLDNGMNYYKGTLAQNYNINDVNTIINSLKQNDTNNQLPFYLNIKEILNECNITQMCTTNFNLVGVKAINDFTLQYTLTKPIPYFLSTLTNSIFLPINQSFIDSIGFNNFGTSKQTLLYNGAYILNNYYHSSRFEYIKNNNYWDKNNVFIDKLIFTKSLNYHSASYARLAYESGNVSEFSLSSIDTEGWKKYVTGNNNSGSVEHPIGNNTYVSNTTTNFITYYLAYNQNRKNNNFTTLSDKEAEIANKALQNNNFRKALSSGLLRSNYFKNENNIPISSVIPKGFIYNNSTDYTEYFINQYGIENNKTINESNLIINTDPFYDIEVSNYYLELAIDELDLSKDDLPIKIEYTYYYDQSHSEYDKAMLDHWNKLLNGCNEKDVNCNFDKVQLVYNTTIDSSNDFNIAFANKEYNISIVGLYPDFNDPLAYLSGFSLNGELYPYLNHSSLIIDEKLKEIDNFYNDSDIATRYTLCSQLEYYILFKENLLLPLSLKGNTNQIVVSDIVPFEKMKSTYGLSPFKFKHKRIATKKYTQQDINLLKEDYEKGRNLYD